MSSLGRILDEIDLRILEILQRKARIPNAEVARQVGMAPSAVLERIRKLEQQGVIEGYEVRLNPAHFGQALIAFVQLQVQSNPDIGESLKSLANIQEVFQISGDYSYLIKLRLTSLQELGRCLREELGRMPGVTRVRAQIVLETLKETRKISLE